MEIKELVHRLATANRFADRMRLPDIVAEDFVQFAALQYQRGKCLHSPMRLLYVDFIRHYSGRYKKLTQEELYYATVEPRTTFEDEVINRIDCKQRVAKLLNSLNADERLILELIFFHDYTQREVAEFFGVTESAICQRINHIASRSQKNISVDAK